MKKTTSIIFFLFISLNLSSQMFNGSFESWDTITKEMSTLKYINPSNWETSNSFTIAGFPNTPISLSSNSTEANYSAKVESTTWGIDQSYPGILSQNLKTHNLGLISFDLLCDSIWQKGSCIVQIIDLDSNTPLYADTIAQSETFQSFEIDRSVLNLNEVDSISLCFIADAINGLYPEEQNGYVSMLVDNVLAYYTLSNNENNFKINYYPNPLTNFIVIETSHQLEIDLLSVNGSLIKKWQISENQRINLNDLETGLYFLRIRDNYENYTIEQLIKN